MKESDQVRVNSTEVSNLINLLDWMNKEFEGTNYYITEVYSDRKDDSSNKGKINVDLIWMDKSLEDKQGLVIWKDQTMMDLRKIIADLYKIKPCNVLIITSKQG